MKNKRWVFFLWCAVLALTMGLPAVSGAQFTANVEALFSSQNGIVRVENNFKSFFSNSQLEGLQQNAYSTDLFASGGQVTVGAEFSTSINSEISFAGLSILKTKDETLRSPVSPSGSDSVLRAVEKIGTAFTDTSSSFGAAAGSQLRVTDVLHSSTGSTLNGNLAYLLQSQGDGQIIAGVAGDFNAEVVRKPVEPSGKATLQDLANEMGVQSGQVPAAQKLTAGFQKLDMHIEFNGAYSGAFQTLIKLQK